MQREFAENALQPVDAMTVWPCYDLGTACDTSNKQLPKTTAEMVLGFEPTNRHERRKAQKLLRQRKTVQR
jgi:hypothetical protein